MVVPLLTGAARIVAPLVGRVLSKNALRGAVVGLRTRLASKGSKTVVVSGLKKAEAFLGSPWSIGLSIPKLLISEKKAPKASKQLDALRELKDKNAHPAPQSPNT